MINQTSNNLQNNYLELIKNLDLRAKSELMVILANEIASSTVNKALEIDERKIVYELAGSWKDDRTVDEMLSDIYSSRISNKKVLESLDD